MACSFDVAGEAARGGWCSTDGGEGDEDDDPACESWHLGHLGRFSIV